MAEPSRIPLCLPYWDERKALNLGARYDPAYGFYIPSDAYLDDFWAWLPRRFNPDAKKPYLLPEMLPVSTWQENIRHKVPQETWDRMRKLAYQAAGHRCEICGERGRPAIEAHEAWGWYSDGVKAVQKLEKILALCPLCHKAHHMGFARRIGMYDDVLKHLKWVNGWTDAELKHALTRAQAFWEEKSKLTWTVDLSWMVTSGYIKA